MAAFFSFLTDGSGGKSSSDCRVRRCGWGVVSLNVVSGAVGGWFGCLPCRQEDQTAPRAELFAFLKILQLTTGGIQIVTDHKNLVTGFYGPRSKSKYSDNCDLWAYTWEA